VYRRSFKGDARGYSGNFQGIKKPCCQWLKGMKKPHFAAGLWMILVFAS